MNGLGTLLLVLVAGQLNNFNSPTLPSASQPVLPQSGTSQSGLPQQSFSATGEAARISDGEPDPRRSFGWDLDVKRDNELYYIIQISPEAAKFMLDEHGFNSEKFSEKATNMPPELVGRVQRVVVRIGDDILPRTPSLEELKLFPRLDGNDLRAALDQYGEEGRIAAVDRPGSIMTPVQQRAPLPESGFNRPTTGPATNSPFSGGSTLGGASAPGAGLGAVPPISSNNIRPPSSLSDNSSGARPSAPNSSGFLNETRGGASNLLPPGDTFSGGLTPPQFESNPGSQQPALTADRRNDTAGMGTSGQPTGYGQPGYGSNANPTYPRGTATQDPPSLGSGNRQTGPVPTFGQVPGYTGTSNANAYNPQSPYAADGYANNASAGNEYLNGNDSRSNGGAGYGGGQMPGRGDYRANNDYRGSGPPPYAGDQFDADPQRRTDAYPGSRLGDGRDAPAARIASASNLERGTETAVPAVRSEATPATPPADTKQEKSRQAAAGIIQVLFLLSLVFNVYLAMLIRKLLGRYRNVLANLRSQTA